jgi:putative ATPase
VSKPRASEGPTLLSHAADRGKLGTGAAPLADRMRPRTLDEIVGQQHLLGPKGLLQKAITGDRVPSMILWGGPGTGKTTLAWVISRTTRAAFEPFSAVLGGVAELREILGRAQARRRDGGRTLLFVDEIHRFNRAQQDAFLPHVENGTVALIGATTENPSFAVNAAVLSRARVFRLEPLADEDIVTLLERALADVERGLGKHGFEADPEALLAIAKSAAGDARRALTQLETLIELLAVQTKALEVPRRLGVEELRALADVPALLFDKAGEEHYNVTSAFIKSLRGTDPDAAVYWMMRLLDAGEDPLFVLRRMMIFASEDVGNADPRGLQVAVAADEAFRRLGMPEGMYPLTHACLYLASCPKSNSVKVAWQSARAEIATTGALPVPKHLRNAPTRLMKAEGYGVGYDYAHDHAEHFAAGATYLPEKLVGRHFYEPSNQGLEQAIADRLARLRALPKEPAGGSSSEGAGEPT